MQWTDCNAVEQDLQRMSGARVFAGARVPATTLLENLDAGATIDEFVDWLPGVSRQPAAAVLQHAGRITPPLIFR